MNNFTALGEIHPDRLLQLEMTAISKLKKEIFYFEFWQIDWGSKDEASDTLLVKPFADGDVTTLVQYSTIQYAYNNMEPYSLIRLYHKLIAHNAVKEGGVHFFTGRDMSYPAMFIKNGENFSVNHAVPQLLQDLDNLLLYIKSKQTRAISKIIYTPTRAINPFDRDKITQPSHRLVIGKITLILCEGQYLEFWAIETMELDRMMEIPIQLRDSIDVHLFIHYISQHFNCAIFKISAP